MQSVITTEGAQRLANAVALNNKRKLVIPGFRASDNSGATEVVATMLAREALAFEGGSIYPSSTTFYPLTEELPVEDEDNPGNWFLEYGLKLDPPDISTSYEAYEVGLYAKEYAVTSVWSTGVSYVQYVDFVSYNDGSSTKYYKCVLSNTSDPTNGPGNTSYWIELTVTEASMLPLVPLPDINEDPNYGRNPFLYYYIVRATYPLYVANTHSTIWRIKIGLSQQQASLITASPSFTVEDCIGFSEVELSFLNSITDMANAERELAREVESLK